MAPKAITGTDTPTKAPDPAKTFTSGRFTFTPRKAEALPIIERGKSGPKGGGAYAFIPEWLNTATHADFLPIPVAFFTAPQEEGGRGVDPTKLPKGTSVESYAKGKIRDQFKAWQKAGKLLGKDREGRELRDRDRKDIVVSVVAQGSTFGDGTAATEPTLAVYLRDLDHEDGVGTKAA